ncbi:MAG: threonine--tRNA ligase [Candidatus Sericytochromatia bacterium]
MDENLIDREDPQYQLHCIRHSAAHIMAHAVERLMPEAKFAIGPVIKDGFYYDMDLPRTLTTEDLEAIETEMKKIVKENNSFLHEDWDKDKARAWFGEHHQDYKLELIEGIKDETVSIYKEGEFTDLCAGPHVRYTKQCKHFKLLKVSGAYWRADENNAMLQRVYGTAWQTKEDLDKYLYQIEEAAKRDHRKLGRELGLVMFHEWAPGAPFWLPKGQTIFRILSDKMRYYNLRNGYVEVGTPQMFRRELWQTSGHWDHYQEHMFIFDDEDNQIGLKAMNCPSHMLIFKSERRSYRELPLRIHDQGVLHRNEKSGALSGLTRVRKFCQDDAHHFVTPEQIEPELRTLLTMAKNTYEVFGMKFAKVYLSTRPDDYMGELEMWNEAEASLEKVIKEAGIKYEINAGDGAFYGPKIDFIIEDALGREWQTATVQLDFQLPVRFDLKYVDQHNEMKTPIVIHRAIYGSLERFIGVLIEHYAGAFPTWLAPVQVNVINLGEAHQEYAEQVHKQLLAAGVRAHNDVRNESVNYKIRDGELHKVPYMLVLGDRELENNTVTVRKLHQSKGRSEAVSLDEFIAMIKAEADVDFKDPT